MNYSLQGKAAIVTGGGGAGLYNPEQQAQSDGWQPFTAKFVSTVNSFTVVGAKGKQLTVKQIGANGDELDRFVITQ